MVFATITCGVQIRRTIQATINSCFIYSCCSTSNRPLICFSSTTYIILDINGNIKNNEIVLEGEMEEKPSSFMLD